MRPFRESKLVTGHGDSGRIVELSRGVAFFAPSGDELVGGFLGRGNKNQTASHEDDRQYDDEIAAYLETGVEFHISFTLEVDAKAGGEDVVVLERRAVEVLYHRNLNASFQDPFPGHILQAGRQEQRGSS